VGGDSRTSDVPYIYRIAGYFGGDIILAYFGDFKEFTKIEIAKFVMYIMFIIMESEFAKIIYAKINGIPWQS
jgi:hypothetical protein